MKVRSAVLRWIPSAFALLLLAGCNFNARQSYLDPKGIIAERQFDLFMVTVWVTAGIFVAVGGALAWTIWRYRERKGQEDGAIPSQSHGNPVVEIGLIVVSVGLLVVIAVPTLREIWFTHDMPKDDEAALLASWYEGETATGAEEEVLTIKATGWQWWFAFEYPQLGIVTGNEFAIPAGKTVRVELRGGDVIHSFWVPKIAGKVDMIPGRNNWMWIRTDEPGYYYGQCAEFCGEAHAYMQFRVQVLPEEEFEQWVAERQQPPRPPAGEDWDEFIQLALNDPEALPDTPAVHGAKLFFGKGACLQCHAIDGTIAQGLSGPNLTYVGENGSIAAGWMEHAGMDGTINPEEQYENFYEWIRRSEEIKPGNKMYGVPGGLKDVDLTDEDVGHLAAFLMTLKSEDPELRKLALAR